MTLHWPARLALILYLVLLALIAFNLTVVLELPLWAAAAPPRRGRGRRWSRLGSSPAGAEPRCSRAYLRSQSRLVGGGRGVGGAGLAGDCRRRESLMGRAHAADVRGRR